MDRSAKRTRTVGLSLPEFARYWACELGGSEQSLVRLSGGMNNFVYRCDARTLQCVVKGYESFGPDRLDRMQAEVDFLKFAAEVAPAYVPKIHHVDFERRCVVLEHIEGETYSEGVMPAAADVDAAVDFFCKLNADRRTAHQMIKLAAAEGFMSLTEHLANVNHRLALMTTEELPNATKLKAKALLCALRLSLEQVADKIKGLIDDGVVADAVTREELCVSPSDFGFHNAIRTPTCMKFIDFEFAGWDDPAKAVSDFALQPRVPTYSQSLQLLSAVPRRQAALVEQRCAALGPLLRLKWACIIAAVLNPEKLRQLSGMCPTPDPSVLIHQRIEHAFRYLQQEAPFGLH